MWSIRIEGAGNCIEDSVCVGDSYRQSVERFPAARQLLSREEGKTFSLLVRDGVTLIFPAESLGDECFARPDSCTAQIQQSQGLVGSDDIIVCRSLIDALTCWRNGLRHVTALLEERAGPVLLQRLGQVRRVLIAFRRDDAGDDAAAVLAGALAERGVAVYRLRLPHGMDVNECAQEADDPAGTLTRLVRNAEWIKDGDEPGATASAASPLPALARPVAAAEVNAHDVIIRLGARIWRVRGLAKNTNVDALPHRILGRY